MVEKIKTFFANSKVKVAEFVVLIAVSAGLIVGGVETEAIATVPGLVAGVITGIAGIAAFISSVIKK
jgi:hypothetical protein